MRLLAAYQTFCQTVWDELGVEPLPETAALAEQIRDVTEERPYQLPLVNQPLVGRKEEVATLATQLADPAQRLQTVVGPGGMGKTRLVLDLAWQAATAYLGPFMHGVFFVPLAGVASVEAGDFNPLVTAVAEAIGFTFAGSDEPQAQLLGYLQDKNMLLVLDNIEHLMTPGRDLILALLQQTKSLNVLVTSRERLNLAEEWVLPLSGLPTTAGDPALNPAMALFVQRAQQVEANFSLAEGNACSEETVSPICQLLEGLPLAIELAAACVRMLTCPEIYTELRQNLDALTATAVDKPQRHHSLRAVFDYSWQLLTPAEQQTLARLAIFQGGFRRQAAAQVAQASLSQLSALLDKSFLRRQPQPKGESAAQARYEMLAVVRQFATERQEAMQQNVAELRQQHGRYFLDFVAAQEAKLQGAEQLQAVAALSQEIENIRLAWRFAVAQGDVAALDKATAALSLFVYMRSWFREGLELFTLAAEQLAGLAPAAVVAKIASRQAWFTFLLGDHAAAQDLFTQSIAQLRQSEDAATLAYALNYLAVVLYVQGDYDAAWESCTEALALGEQHQLTYGRAISNNILSQIAYLQKRYEVAQTHSQTSLQLEQQLGNRWSMGFSLVNLGRVAYAMGDFTQAREHYEESLAIRKAMQDARGQGLCCLYLGDTAVASQDYSEATTNYQHSLAIFRQIGDQATVEKLHGRLATLSVKPDADERG